MVNADDYGYEPANSSDDNEYEYEDEDDEEEMSLGSGGMSDSGGASLEGQDIAAGLTESEGGWLRSSVITVLLVATILVSAIVHVTTSNAEYRNFYEAFFDASTKVLDSLHDTVERKLGAVDGLALDLSSFARSTAAGKKSGPNASNTSWPMMTLPDFSMRGASTLNLAGAVSVMLLPLVTEENRGRWEDYAVTHQQWIDEGAEWERETHQAAGYRNLKEMDKVLFDRASGIPHEIFNVDGVATGPGPFAPMWQTAPVLPGETESWVNFDLLSLENFKGGLHALMDREHAVIGEVSNLDGIASRHTASKKQEASLTRASFNQFLQSLGKGEGREDNEENENDDDVGQGDPVSPLFYPVFDRRFDSHATVVAVLTTMMSWRCYFTDVLPPSAKGVDVVVQNEYDQSFTYQISGKEVSYMGEGDLHDSHFDSLGKSLHLVDSLGNSSKSYRTVELDRLYCSYSVHVYPSHKMKDQYVTHRPMAYTASVAFIFLFAASVFLTYDCLVERRQKALMNQAQHSAAIVSSLFPETVRDRLFHGTSSQPTHALEHEPDDHHNESGDEVSADVASDFSSLVEPAKLRLKTFLTDEVEGGSQSEPQVRPIADLFLNCTVLFADIAGFTAWSSLRDPAQVFTLLEGVYQAFDRIARRRGVFKVETVGDSYVAVTGLPDPQEDHAVLMARFARDCRIKMREVTGTLELSLGPDTGDLRMRFGLHSGPVTAGVLRGEKSRFQLFGDTVNTAARMESTGERDRIQVSQATADLIREAGKGKWLRRREKLVHAKGKGEMQTYFLEVSSSRSSMGSQRSGCSEDSSGRQTLSPHESKSGRSRGNSLWGKDEEIPDEVAPQRSKHQRLIDYNVDLLTQHLKRVVARRMVLATIARRSSTSSSIPPCLHGHALSTDWSTVLEEVTETIKLPSFDPKAFKAHVDPDSIQLDPAVISQLKRYVTIIAAMYRNNPFHNFEHASHVTMSVNKLLQRVVQPDINIRADTRNMDGSLLKKQIASDLHDYTYGITSDPLTQFAVVFSALIHDVDHWGISNAQMIKEGVPIAAKYKNKSIAEQNSVDRAWDLLMDTEEYYELQRCIFPTDSDYKRFRQVVVNVVMATDIFDKELNELRKNRWSKAFEETPKEAVSDADNGNRKATIVIEHIMQASDVAHTMQHWHVYQKWNRRLFDELYTAYRAGRADTDPTEFWYEGEMKFLDGYVMPLAKKLKDCGVFGVSSDECLNYAMGNRKEWEAKGQQLVAEMVSSFNAREMEETQAPPSRRRRQRSCRRRSLVTSAVGDY